MFRYTTSSAFGYTWETQFAGTSGNGSITIDEDHPRFMNIDDDDNLNFSMGATLSKMGQASGWTTGNINATCATESQYENGSPSGKTLLCQYDVHARSVGGDSGSPVFSYFISGVDPSVRWAFPHGILWGGDDLGNYAFSPISAMRTELGGFVVGF